jgi:hypothetical protein
MRVALDSGVFIRGILMAKIRPTDHRARILQSALSGAFTLVICPRVDEEVRRVLTTLEAVGESERLLARSKWEWGHHAEESDLELHYLKILACVPDPPDARIGVEVRCTVPPIDVFVSDNRADWSPSVRLTERLGGVEVMRPRTFLKRTGVTL